jgi:acyl carrier protein
MARRPSNLLRFFTLDGERTPIGIVALGDVSPAFRTANLWYVLGARRHGGRGLTTRAVGRLLSEAFRTQGLASVQAWAVETNHASIAVLERNGFRLVGRRRRCHVMDGHPHDRLLYDLLAEEHEDRTMHDDIARRIQTLFETCLHVAPPPLDADLLDGDVIDSLQLVTLLSEVERAFEVRIPLGELDLERVGTLRALAALVQATERCRA